MSGDIRCAAKDRQRTSNHVAKWARGYRPTVGHECPHDLTLERQSPCEDCRRRPNMRTPRPSYHRREYGHQLHGKRRAVQINFKVDVDEALDDEDDSYKPATDDEVFARFDQPSRHEVMYSFDASAGPNGGYEVFDSAFTRAIEQFEKNQAEKLVLEFEQHEKKLVETLATEYDIISDEWNDELVAALMDDGFELIQPHTL